MHLSLVTRVLGAVLLLATPAFASSGGGEIPNPAAEWDTLWHHLLIDIFVIGAVFAIAAIIMLVKYKAKSIDEVGDGPKLSNAQMWGWALIPAFIFMADDFYLAAKGWTVWNTYRTVPENALEVKVTGMMWSWEFEYENGKTTEYLKVPVGKPVVLRMTSDDVVHSFMLPKYRVKEDLMPGRVTYLWFNPIEVGKTYVNCAEFCGTQHAEMFTDVIVVSESEFEEWIESSEDEASATDKQPAIDQAI
jgi:cytochrome c oxidase subunit 2